MLPVHICWFVWLARNEHSSMLRSLPSFTSALSFCRLQTNLVRTFKSKPTVRRPLHIPVDRAVAWFDGASQLGGSLCGAGGQIKINSHSSIHWTLNCCQGTNTKAELIGAWTSLILASRHTDVLLLLGDSKITIDWLNGKADLQVAALNSWKARTKDAYSTLQKSYLPAYLP
jgi:hypothetical protein